MRRGSAYYFHRHEAAKQIPQLEDDGSVLSHSQLTIQGPIVLYFIHFFCLSFSLKNSKGHLMTQHFLLEKRTKCLLHGF